MDNRFLLTCRWNFDGSTSFYWFKDEQDLNKFVKINDLKVLNALHIRDFTDLEFDEG